MALKVSGAAKAINPSLSLSSRGGSYSTAKDIAQSALSRFSTNASLTTKLAGLGVASGLGNAVGIVAGKSAGQSTGDALKTGALNALHTGSQYAQAMTPASVADVFGGKSGSVSSSADPGSVPSSAEYVSVPSDGGTEVSMPDYLYADLAKAYGMDASTAYQEALSNTSYQRAVKDLEAAGINPLFAVGGYNQGAGGVYAAHLAGAGAGSSPVSTGVSSAKGAHTYYNLLSNAGTAIGAIVAGRTGSIAGKAIGTILGNALDG